MKRIPFFEKRLIELQTDIATFGAEQEAKRLAEDEVKHREQRQAQAKVQAEQIEFKSKIVDEIKNLGSRGDNLLAVLNSSMNAELSITHLLKKPGFELKNLTRFEPEQLHFIINKLFSFSALIDIGVNPREVLAQDKEDQELLLKLGKDIHAKIFNYLPALVKAEKHIRVSDSNSLEKHVIQHCLSKEDIRSRYGCTPENLIEYFIGVDLLIKDIINLARFLSDTPDYLEKAVLSLETKTDTLANLLETSTSADDLKQHLEEFTPPSSSLSPTC